MPYFLLIQLINNSFTNKVIFTNEFSVNNVGINYEYPMRIHEMKREQMLNIININLVSTTMMTRIVLPIMLKNKRGAIVNVSSGSELQPWPLMTLYASSKVSFNNNLPLYLTLRLSI